MSNINMQMIKELRERTGVGMSKCKDALVRAGSIEGAIEILRKEGMAAAVKKEGRAAKDGFIGYFEDEKFLSLVELNCETDFVAQNEKFKIFLKSLAQQVVVNRLASLEELLQDKFISDDSMSTDQYRNILVQKFGENIQIKRTSLIEKSENSSYGIYSHMGGKIVSIVEIEGKEEKVLAKEIAMHVVAERPEYLKKEDIKEDVIEKEKEIAKAQIKDKPDHIKDKIVEGKMKSFYETVCLKNQKYVKDPSVSVEQFIQMYSVKNKKNLSLKNFWYWKIG